MASIALIGGDGAGKTTVARMLRNSFPKPMKYLYMGMNMTSSNVALPTSRFIQFLKTRSFRKANGRMAADEARPFSLHELAEDRKHDTRGKVGATLRLLNRMAEEWFRQAIAWSYQMRGYLVLYDRHFAFDSAPDALDMRRKKQRLSDRIHRWSLNHLYAKPDLVIFLDAPPEVLFARKGEATIEFLRARREAFLKKGEETSHFYVVDATQPLDSVFAEVLSLVSSYFMPDHGAQQPAGFNSELTMKR